MKNLFGWLLFIILAVMLFLLLDTSKSQHAAISLDDFSSRLKSDRVQVVVVGADELLGKFRDGEMIGGERLQLFRVPLPAGTTQDWSFTQWLIDNRRNAQIRVNNHPNWLVQVIIPLIPWLLIFGFIWFFVFRNLRKMQSIDPNAPRPVNLVPPPQGHPMPPLSAVPQQLPPSPPTMPAPGGDNRAVCRRDPE